MLDPSPSAQSHTAVGHFWHRYYWPLLLIALAPSVGCSAGRYRAATLPAQFRAPRMHAHHINLANMSGLGDGSSVIGRGDLVAITIASGGEEQRVEPVLARVGQNGAINVPLVGDIPIAGIEPVEAADRIAAASIERGIYRQPAVVLRVEEPAVNQVTVLGAVTKPGIQKLPRGSSDVLSAIAAAGGFTQQAGTQVEVMRHGSSTFLSSNADTEGVVTASYNEPFAPPPIASASKLAGGPPATANAQSYRLDLAQANPSRPSDYRVGDGDVVMVLPEKERIIHVSGLVNRPDQFKIPKNQDVHVLDAIAMAGGIKSPVADKVYVIRRLEHLPEPAVIEVSIAKAKKDKNENLALASGDLVSVEATVLTNTVDTITMFFRLSFGIGGNFTTF